MSDYLTLENVTKVYPTPKGLAIIVKDFNLTIKKGEFVALIGHSGCGKSTVLSMVAGLNDISGGGMILAGKELVGPGPDRGIVFQSPCLLPWFTAFENVMLGVDQVFYTASKNGASANCRILSACSGSGRFNAQASIRALSRDASARGYRTCVRPLAEDAFAG